MTHTTEQERAEFEAWAKIMRYLLDRMEDQPESYEEDNTNEAWRGWQAARRAPAVQPDQLPPDAAKRAMEELQTEVEKLRSALAECRDACPIPKPGASNEDAWMQSIGDPESVPAFVKSCFCAPAVPVPQGWQPVPIEPTQEMQDAMHTTGHAPTRYAAMLAAAPQPPEADMGNPYRRQHQHNCLSLWRQKAASLHLLATDGGGAPLSMPAPLVQTKAMRFAISTQSSKCSPS